MQDVRTATTRHDMPSRGGVPSSGGVLSRAEMPSRGATQHAHSAPAPGSCKPEAPIAVEITTRVVGEDASGGVRGGIGGAAGVMTELEVLARAIPSANVASIDLQIALPPHATAIGATRTRVGTTLSGGVVTLTTRVRVDGRTSSIAAIARVPVEGIEMARTATIAIGAPEPAQRTRAYALPDGELAREVRP